MSLNSSFSSNATLPNSSLSSINEFAWIQSCFKSTVGFFSITTFLIINVLVLFPLYSLVLYLGLQRWLQQRSVTTMSHSDLFTYHMVIVELLSVLGFTLAYCGIHTDLPQMTMVGTYLFSINLSGQMLFHILTCVERYLAVIHPVTYLSLRKSKGIRIRNISISCAWLLSFAGTGLISVGDQVALNILCYCILGSILIVVSFCSLSVLCVLIRPGPGEGGGGTQQADQSKLRAFHTIMAILGVLLIRFGGNILITAMYNSPQLGKTESCGLWLSIVWFSLPSSLVLPLLFLQRAGKLLCCKNNNESG